MTPKQTTKLQGVMSDASHNYNKGLNTHAFFKVSSHSIGQDLVQDTFMRTWGHLVRGGKIETMKAFLYHVLNNLIVDQYRRHKTVSLDALVEGGFEPPERNSGRALDILDGKALFLLIGSLPLAYQDVMRKRYVQDLSITEIALLTGRSKNNISVRVYRGLRKLRLLYDGNINKQRFIA